MPTRPRIVRLNVGGHVFETAASTLTSGSAFFSRLLSADFSDLDPDSGEAFVDRDGRFFPYILGYLRSGAVELPQPPLTMEGLVAEAEYFGVESLVHALREAAEPPPLSTPELRADGLGCYVWRDPAHPEILEAVCFQSVVPAEAVGAPASAEPAGAEPGSAGMTGTLVFSRGPCARENLIALRSMPKPLPRIWRDSGDASTIIAFFTQRFVSRGHFKVEGSALLMTRGNLSDADSMPGTHPSSAVSTCGIVMSATELFLLEPTAHGGSANADAARAAAPLLEQLGLSTARSGMGGLGGGFKRFVFEPF